MADLEKRDDEANAEQDMGLSSGSGPQFERRPNRERPSSGLKEPAERLPPIERVRFRIAVGVLCGFFGLIGAPTIAFLVAMFVTESAFGVDDFVRVVTTLSAATAGLAGAVVGYYFGQNSSA